MTAYRNLIWGVIILLIGCGLFFFHKAGVADLVANDIEQGKGGSSYGVSAIEVFSGSYECIEKNGCKNTTRLILQQDTTLDITAVIDGEEVSLGQGTWGIGTSGALVLIINNGNPNSMIAKNISTFRITGFSTKKGLFPGMENPTFTRVGGTDSKTSPGAN